MTLDTRARAAAQALRRSATRVDPAAGLEELLHRRRRRLVARAATALATATAVALVAWSSLGGLPRDEVIQPPGSLGG
jgi:hypothetical protein